ncbi:MAG: choice-of-anchor J domain-containing protein [Bacteroidota bacterium]|nr:choice-of-anchor J domain-containing protein [Bacteroidota bacterium]
MKKQLLAIAFLASGVASAQVWSENFNAATGSLIPVGWFQNNVDGLTPNASIAAYNFGTNSGVTRNVTTAFGLHSSHANVLLTTSRYTSPGTSNDWVISPNFNVPANAVFNWDATSFDPTATGFYEVRISTTGTTVANFTANPALFSISGEIYNPGDAAVAGFTQRGVSLAAYVGQNVHIAIRDIGTDRWQIAYDNFSVSVPANQHDGSVLSVNGLTRYMVGAGNQNINGSFKQLGYGTATTAVMNYNVNNGTPVTQTITFAPSVPYFGTQNFAFTTPANLTLGTNKIKVWVSNINGSPQAVAANDTASQFVYVASQSVTINALIEEFTSSTCGPCASLNNTFDPLLTSNNVNMPGSNLNAVKYQVNWPNPGNDPSYNPDVLTRRNYYGVNSAPTVLYNGVAGSGNQTNINIAKMAPAYANITPTITFSGGAVTANATVTPFITIPSSSPIRVYQALVQSEYNYPGASTSQKNYHHAMRKMFTASGTTYNTTDGTPFNVTYNHTLTYGSTAAGTPAAGSTNFWTSTGTFVYEYVIWLQDDVNRQVLQSHSAFTSSVVVPSQVKEYANNNSIGIFPNPAKDYAVVGIKLENNSFVDISIIDITGKLVYTNKAEEVVAGTSEITINTSEFATGTYNVIVKTNNGILKEKLIVVK